MLPRASCHGAESGHRRLSGCVRVRGIDWSAAVRCRRHEQRCPLSEDFKFLFRQPASARSSLIALYMLRRPRRPLLVAGMIHRTGSVVQLHRAYLRGKGVIQASLAGQAAGEGAQICTGRGAESGAMPQLMQALRARPGKVQPARQSVSSATRARESERASNSALRPFACCCEPCAPAVFISPAPRCCCCCSDDSFASA